MWSSTRPNPQSPAEHLFCVCHLGTSFSVEPALNSDRADTVSVYSNCLLISSTDEGILGIRIIGGGYYCAPGVTTHIHISMLKMSGEEVWSSNEEEYNKPQPPFGNKSGYDSRTGIYHSLVKLDTKHELPTKLDLNTANFVLSQFPQAGLAEARIAFIDSSTNRSVSYAELRQSIYSLASALFHGLEVRKGDVVLVLSPNSIL
ncbi:uncharacterized protein LOC109804990 [Cajanus cajan]|uniref:uncharacterized protein LOC109804990 n=1 Tax=Cajanus cajan TaxID=3821 RepID=UPI00098D9FD4|nr:uncharacterized protein LOC109804990 [Cajanus cajan]